MTVSQFIDTVRRRHNAENDTNWSDEEIMELLTHRCNEVLGYIGLIEDISSSTSTAGTQVVAYPSDAVSIRQVNYKGQRLKRITFQQWEYYKNDTTTVSGLPTMYTIWENQIYLIPVPVNTSDAIDVYYYRSHAYIDDVNDTIDIPSVLHPHLVHGVLADMYAKDLNVQLTQFYEDKWLNISIPAFYSFKSKEVDAGQFSTMGDPDVDDIAGEL